MLILYPDYGSIRCFDNATNVSSHVEDDIVAASGLTSLTSKFQVDSSKIEARSASQINKQVQINLKYSVSAFGNKNITIQVTATGVFQRFTAPSPFWLLILGTCVIMIPVTAALVYIFAVSQVSSSMTDDECTNEYGPVVGITMMHRHGARTIDGQFPKDPYRFDKFWPEGIGELTKEGILQHYLQGQWIACEYKHLVPHNYMDIHDRICVVSTDWNRTLMSAEANLAGIFKIHDDADSWHGLQSYLVPIHSYPEDEDKSLEVTKKCPRLAALLQKNIQSDRYQRIMKKNQEVANTLEYNLGVNITNLDDYQQLYSILSIEKERGHKLGKWADAVYPQPLKDLATISFAAPTWTKQLKRLRGGQFIKELVQNILRKVNDPRSPCVMRIYSAHDTSISAFLNSLNDLFQVEKLGPPPFAALVIVEHRQKDSRNYVRILYRCPYSKEDSPECHTVPRVLSIPGCEAVCPLEKMLEIVHDVIPVDWEEECLNTEDEGTPDNSPSADMVPPDNSPSADMVPPDNTPSVDMVPPDNTPSVDMVPHPDSNHP